MDILYLLKNIFPTVSLSRSFTVVRMHFLKWPSPSSTVWPDWVSFEKSCATNILTKLAKIFRDFLVRLEKTLLGKNYCGYFFGQLWKKMELFFISTSGHTDYHHHRHRVKDFFWLHPWVALSSDELPFRTTNTGRQSWPQWLLNCQLLVPTQNKKVDQWQCEQKKSCQISIKVAQKLSH